MDALDSLTDTKINTERFTLKNTSLINLIT